MESIDLHLQKLRQLGDAPLKPCPYISDKFRPIPPHKVGIAHLVLKPRFLLADPTGCGKTPQSLAAYGFLKQRDPKLKLLAMVEKSAIFQWQQSVHDFLIGVKPTIVGYEMERGESVPVGRFARYKTYEDQDADVFLLSYHQMARDINVILHNLDNYVIVFDEVQYLKSNQGTSLYPAAQKLSTKGRYAWGLSATPTMEGKLEELYSIMEVLRPGTFGSFEAFKAHHCNYILKTTRTPRGLRHYYALDDKNPNGTYKNPYKNIHEVMKIVRPFFIKRPPEAFDEHLPKVVTKDVILDMKPEQSKIYHSVMDKHFPTLDGERRLKSILSSLIYAQLASDGPSTLKMEGDSSKMEALIKILLEELNGEKVIIYTNFRRTVDYICDNLTLHNIAHVRITGREHKPSQRNNAKLVFNDPSSGVNVICINKAGGTSLDLQQASIEIFYSLPWSWGVWTQVLGRARRIGSPHSRVLAILLVNRGTIDHITFDRLKHKESLVEQTIGVDDSALDLSPERLAELYEMVRSKVA